ncbi:MAG TPA: FecR domain-containing protein [Prolixibacteraceae bacterium]|nr:FecR domain-containing protein [Prolixibacteraceae bacterium]
MKEELKDIIQNYSEGKISLKEHIDLADQLSGKHGSYTEEILYSDWKSQLASETIIDRNLDTILDKVHHRIRLNESKKPTQINWIQTFQRVAAILIFPLLLSLAYLYLYPAQEIESNSYAEIYCPMGVRSKFILPDGSTGYLNSGSILKYPVSFTHERKVELIGEAFFDVVHNKEIPFHVKTQNLDIKVLGTTFNVIANTDEETEEIVLQTGQVDISSKDGNQLAILKPNEELTLDINKRTYSKSTVEASQYTSWKEGKLIFRNENMQQMARRISRWYNVDVVVDDLLLNYTFHATFIDEPLDEVLKLLSITTPISYREEKRESHKDGVYQKRKIYLGINRSKINQFR